MSEKVATRLIILITSIFAIYFTIIAFNATTYRVPGERSSVGPWLFPMFIFITILIVNSVLFFSQYKNKINNKDDNQLDKKLENKSKLAKLVWNVFPKTPVLTIEFIVLIVLYVGLWKRLSFVVSSLFFMWGSSILLCPKSKLTIIFLFKSFILILIIISSINFVFKSIFSVPLP